MLDKIKVAFNSQKHHCKERGILFDFTFENWCKWWEQQLGPSWFSKRGCRRGQYVMARIADVGPYSETNVKCITQEQNGAEKRVNKTSTFGELHPLAKLTEDDVKYIKLSKIQSLHLAKRFNVCPNTIRDIRSGRRWAHL